LKNALRSWVLRPRLNRGAAYGRKTQKKMLRLRQFFTLPQKMRQPSSFFYNGSANTLDIHRRRRRCIATMIVTTTARRTFFDVIIFSPALIKF